MGVCKKGERLGLILMRDCESKEQTKLGPNVHKLVMHCLEVKTQRERRGGDGGRKDG